LLDSRSRNTFFWLTVVMTEWDSRAAERLADVVEQLGGADVINVLHDQIGRVWRANLSRYEPTELGDTPRALGLLSWSDVAQLVFRHFAGAAGGRAIEVRASLPNSSLLIETVGVRLQVMKAPGPLRTPDWDGFSWHESDSKTRYRAAVANSMVYAPVRSDQGARELLLADLDTPATFWGDTDDPVALRDFMVVWSGDPESGATAGWIGLPSIGQPSWFAIESLWWDEGDDRGVQQPTGAVDGADTFADRREPTLNIAMRHSASEQQR